MLNSQRKTSLEAPKADKRILLSFKIISNPPTKNITLFKFIILFYEINNVLQNVPYISHITLLRIWIMLRMLPWPLLLVRLQQMIWRKYTFVLCSTIYLPCSNAWFYNTSAIQRISHKPNFLVLIFLHTLITMLIIRDLLGSICRITKVMYMHK